MVPDAMLHMHLAFAAMHSTARTLPPPPRRLASGHRHGHCLVTQTVWVVLHGASPLSSKLAQHAHGGARNSRMWHAARGRLRAGVAPLGWSHEPLPYPWSSPPGTAIQRSSSSCKSAEDICRGSSLTPIPEPWMSLDATFLVPFCVPACLLWKVHHLKSVLHMRHTPPRLCWRGKRCDIKPSRYQCLRVHHP